MVDCGGENLADELDALARRMSTLVIALKVFAGFIVGVFALVIYLSIQQVGG